MDAEIRLFMPLLQYISYSRFMTTRPTSLTPPPHFPLCKQLPLVMGGYYTGLHRKTIVSKQQCRRVSRTSWL